MAFVQVPAELIPSGQLVLDGDVQVRAFTRNSKFKGASTNLLTLAPALTLIGNLLTTPIPARSWSMATFAGIGLTLNTSVAAGNFPEVATRDVQVNTVASTGHTYTYPLARQVGQLLLVAVATAALTTITTPAGWTSVATQAGTESRLTVFKRTLDGTEASTELLAFGTASGCVVRTWCINIANTGVEFTSGLNDSAAGTSLDLGAVTPTWAVTEATNTLYIAVLGLADDVTVSAFPTGYTVTGQDKSVSATANLDCALAYAEKSSLGSTEDPSAFTYAASRSTGHILAIQPKVTGRIDWDGVTVRKNTGSNVGTRRRLNLIEGAGVTLTVADDSPNDEVDVTIAAAAGSAHVIRDDGVDQTARAALNFVSSTTINAICTDDAANGETEATFQLNAFAGGDVTSSANSLVLTIANNAVTNTKAADMAALSVKANATNATADPSDVAAAADDTVFRRTSTTLNWGQLTVGMAPNSVWTYAKIQNVSATSRFLGRITAGAGVIEELTGTQATTLLDVFTSALKGLAPASGGGTVNFLRADGTWATPPDTNTGHVLRVNGTGQTQRAALNFLDTTTIAAAGADDSVNGETEISFTIKAITGGDIAASANSVVYTINNNAVTYAKMQDVSATSRFIGRITAGAGDPEELTGTQATTLLDVFTSALKGLAPASGGGTTNFLRADGTWAAPGGSPGHVIRDDGTNQTQRAALNFVSSTTISAICTDDAANGETEATFQLNAFAGGDVTSSANSLVLTIGTNVVTNAKAAQMAALTVKANATNALANATDVAAAADDTVFRRTSTTLNWGQLTVGMAPNSVWTYAKIQNVSATSLFLGRITAGAGVIEELTGTQATTLLNNFTSALKGLAPASGGGTTNFLRADGTWTAPTFTLASISDDFMMANISGASAAPIGISMSARAGASLTYNTSTHAFDYTGTTTQLTLTSITGNQGTVDISTLVCGGILSINTPTGDWSIEGFTSTPVKPDGFWFQLVTGVTAFRGTLFDEDVTAGATDRLRNSGARDVSGLSMHTHIYKAPGTSGGSSRWRCVTGVGAPFINSPSYGNRDMISHDGTDWQVIKQRDLIRILAMQEGNSASQNMLWEDEDFHHYHVSSLGVTAATDAFVSLTNGTLSPWKIQATSGTVTVTGQFLTGHKGVIRLATGATTNNNGLLFLTTSTVTTGQIAFDNIVVMHFWVRVVTLTTLLVAFGVAQDPSASNFGTHQVSFNFTAPTNTNWQLSCRNAGTTSNTSSSTAPTTGWTKLTIHRVSASLVEFYVNGVSVGTVTGNIPTATLLLPFVHITTTSAAVRTVDVDRIQIWANEAQMRV